MKSPTNDFPAAGSVRPAVLFLCVHNAGRSQMAAALLSRLAGERVTVFSAGSNPGDSLNPSVVHVLAERGIDIAALHPQKITDEMALSADVIVTMGCGDSCPVYPGKRYIDWEIADPAGKPVDQVRPICDEIDRRVTELFTELVSPDG